MMLFALDQPSLVSPEPGVPLGLFFSVFPDAQTTGRIAQIARDLRCEYRLKGRPFLPARFHCSLYGLGNLDTASQIVVAKAQAAASMVTASPFRVSFNCVMSFSNPSGRYPLVLTGDDGAVGLLRLHASLCRAMRQVGLRPQKYSNFTPHLTLLYDARHIDEQPIEPIGWTVNEFVLVLSMIGKTKHVPIQRWQLHK
jgi:RNA 2',3'-cyclic 3'-phosphodiesterase